MERCLSDGKARHNFGGYEQYYKLQFLFYSETSAERCPFSSDGRLITLFGCYELLQVALLIFIVMGRLITIFFLLRTTVQVALIFL